MLNNKTVVITGTSTGIGRACALHLDELGFRVYAGVRKQSDGESLMAEASERLKPIVLDVTSTETIKAAADTIEEETDGSVFGLINNAGIGRGGALEVTPVSEIQKVMNVNVIGLMEVTQTFIPMLRKDRGRIINIGSTSSLLAVPGASVYSASKFAVRAISDSLRLELKPFGISVILLVLGAVESEIWEKGKAYKAEMRKTIKAEIAQLYAPLIKFGEKIDKEMKKIPASVVAKQVAEALLERKPRPYYIVGNDAKSAARVTRLPKGVLDWLILKHMGRLAK
ncbi:MAG: SDR family oxidoreductase [Planctomycetota bacterium]|jgi:NAD(P)-dependent dehydrogenase (short-subunit alcohol dehydrogenase family)